MSTSGLRLEQAPPLSVPASFFLIAPVALVGAGAVLAFAGSSLLWTRFAGGTAALVHLGTLGFLAQVMFGALYQMIPVVAGSPVPAVRVAHAVHAGLVAGLVALVVGLAASSRAWVVTGAGVLGLVMIAFLVPVGIALARAPARGPTVTGMRLALLGLLTLVALGLAMGALRGAGLPAPRYPSWLAVHLTAGLVVWIGGLVSAVSIQVIPMFYLTPPLPFRTNQLVIGSIGVTLLGLWLAVGLDLPLAWIPYLAAPGAIAVWVVQPVVVLRAIRARRRRRADPSLWFWRAGLGAALSLIPLGALALLADDTRWAVLFGWVALWGWAALIVHGMLTRILPFLVWFHRFSARVGHERVPTMRELLPDRYAKLGFALHVATLASGVVAAGSRWPLSARATGVGICLTGVALFATISRVLRFARAPAAG